QKLVLKRLRRIEEDLDEEDNGIIGDEDDELDDEIDADMGGLRSSVDIYGIDKSSQQRRQKSKQKRLEQSQLSSDSSGAGLGLDQSSSKLERNKQQRQKKDVMKKKSPLNQKYGSDDEGDDDDDEDESSESSQSTQNSILPPDNEA
ncbi:MAG: hypothetical protein EZS28_052803, partial [Streblomastix strix]